MKSLRAIGTTIVGTILFLGACDPSTVEIRFDPRVGDRYEYRSEISTKFERVIDDEIETQGAEHTVLAATEEVVAVDGDEITLEIALERDGVPARSHSVELRRGDHFSAIDLIEPGAAESLGLHLATDLAAPPAGPLRVGLRWDIHHIVEVSTDADGAADPIPVSGTGRVRSLGIRDDREVVIVDVTLEMPIQSRIVTAWGVVRMTGSQTTTATSTYDLADGSLRSNRQTIIASADLVVDPPAGVLARPTPGSLTYRLQAETTRNALGTG